jgi:tetratricopeptide (TPR) repeat protein
LDRFEASLALTRADRNELSETIALHHVAWAHLALGQLDEAAAEFRAALELSAELGHEEGVAYGLEAMAVVVAADHDIERAGSLLGAAQSIRDQTGLRNSFASALYGPMVQEINSGPLAGIFGHALVAGRSLSVQAAVALAVGPDAR